MLLAQPHSRCCATHLAASFRSWPACGKTQPLDRRRPAATPQRRCGFERRQTASSSPFLSFLAPSRASQTSPRRLCSSAPLAAVPVSAGEVSPGVVDANSCNGGSFDEAGSTSASSPSPGVPPQDSTRLSPDATALGALALPRILSIAGSDSGAGAGIQADLKTAAALGVWCCTAVSALTAQNSLGVQGSLPTPPSFLRLQLHSILSNIGADAIKTGMLPNSEAVHTVCQCIKEWAPGVPLVVDPVLVSTSGDSLAEHSALQAMRSELVPLATVLTPNLREAEVLLGIPTGSIQDVLAMKEAAQQLILLGARGVFLKGGHLPGTEDAVDVYLDAEGRCEVLSSPRIDTSNTHGTGCTLASAIAAELALGRSLLEALKLAKAYLLSTLEASRGLSLGQRQGSQGPLNHLPALLLPRGQAGRATLGTAGAEPRGLTPAGTIEFDAEKHLRLYAVTDSRMNQQWGRSLDVAVRQAALGGASIIQIREKDVETGQFVEEVAKALKVTRELGIPLVVNDRIDVALATGADGVHVGQSDMPASLARRLLGPHKILGVSAKTVEQAVKAADDGADYVGVGGVYPTTTKAGNTTVGIAGLENVCAGSPIPVVAIGGINEVNVHEVWKDERSEKLKGVAVVSALFNKDDVRSATEELRKLIV